MTELGQGSFRCSGQVTSARRSECEVKACEFWELRELNMKIVNIWDGAKMTVRLASDPSPPPT